MFAQACLWLPNSQIHNKRNRTIIGVVNFQGCCRQRIRDFMKKLQTLHVFFFVETASLI